MKTKIASFGTTKLTLAAHAQFNELINIEVGNSDPIKLHLETLAPLYAAAVLAEKDVVNRPSAYAETPQMIAADHKRDLVISLGFNIIDAYLKSASDVEIAAAQRLHAIVAPYRGIQSHEYNRQTSETDGLIASLDGALPADIALLGLGSCSEQLDAYNGAFKVILAERSTDVGTRAPIADASSRELRIITDGYYRDIVETVNAFIVAIPSAELETFAVAINALITQYKLVAANQGKKKSATPVAEIV